MAIAERNGHGSAERGLEIMEAKMTPSQIGAAERRADEWMKAHKK